MPANDISAHPAEEALRKFAGGELAEDTKKQVLQHVLGCEECARVLRGFAQNEETSLRHISSAPDDTSKAEGHSTNPPAELQAGGDPYETLPITSSRRIPAGQNQQVDSFGDYELISEIARGGMGVVYRARQNKMNRVVALKMILSGQFASAEDVKRFYTEAEAAGKLDHPGIVPVYEVGECDGRHFFSMGFVEGQSLAAKIADGPLPSQEAVQLMRQISEAIAYAHGQGVIHRDLKPANVLVDQQGAPRVTDFGLAKNLENESGLTQTGSVMGTPSYMPPEQASGKMSKIGPLADVYSLGAMLYCLLTGRPPFQAPSAVDTLLQVVDTDPVPPRRLNPRIPADLETVCLKCLDKDPAKRYKSAGALAEELDRFLRGEPILARPIGRAARGVRWCKRNPVVATLVAGILFVLVTGLSVSAALAVLAQNERQKVAAANVELSQALANATTQKELAEQQTARAEQSEKAEAKQLKIALLSEQLAKTNAAEAKRQQLLAETNAEEALAAKVAEQKARQATLAALTQAQEAASDERTAKEKAEVAQVKAEHASQEAERAKTLAEETQLLALKAAADEKKSREDADKQRLLALAEAKRAKEATAAKVAALQSLEESNAELNQTLNDLDRQHAIALYALDLREVQRSMEQGDLTLAQRILVETPTEMRSWEWRVLAKMSRLPDAISKIIDDAERPGQRVLPNPTRQVTGAGRPLQLSGHRGAVYGIAVSPDQKWMATAGEDRIVRIWSTDNWRMTKTLVGHTDTIRAIAFLPNNEQIASAGLDGTVRLWDLASGRQQRTLRSGNYTFYCLAVSPDGRYLCAGAGAPGPVRGDPKDPTRFKAWVGKAICWNLEDGSEAAEFLKHTSIVRCVTPTKDSRSFITGGYDAQLYKWKAATGQQVQQFSGHYEPILSIAINEAESQLCSAAGPLETSFDLSDLSTRFVGGIRLWDLNAAEEFAKRKTHESKVYAVAFTDNDRRILTGAADETLRVWAAETQQHLLTLSGQGSEVFALGQAFDGDVIVTGGKDGKVTVWDGRIPEFVDAFTRDYSSPASGERVDNLPTPPEDDPTPPEAAALELPEP